MPPKRPASFVPPRPAADSSKSTSAKRKSLPSTSKTTSNPISLSDSEDHETPSKDSDAANIIPPALLTTIINSHFKDASTGIGKDAQQVMAKYIEMFVQEAIARAVHERREVNQSEGGGRRGEFLEVEDLEKIAAQLVLDF